MKCSESWKIPFSGYVMGYEWPLSIALSVYQWGVWWSWREGMASCRWYGWAGRGTAWPSAVPPPPPSAAAAIKRPVTIPHAVCTRCFSDILLLLHSHLLYVHDYLSVTSFCSYIPTCCTYMITYQWHHSALTFPLAVCTWLPISDIILLLQSNA